MIWSLCRMGKYRIEAVQVQLEVTAKYSQAQLRR